MGEMFLRGRAGGGGSSSTSTSSSSSSISSSRLTYMSMVFLPHLTRSDRKKTIDTSHAAIFGHGIVKITFKQSDHVHMAIVVRSA
jgi:hypothetical protein